MGIFSRFTDIINSNINAILDKAEDPEKMVRLIIQEMEDTLVEVRSASAKTIAAKKDVSHQINKLKAESDDWQAKAELALSKDRDDLARAALQEKAKSGEAAASLEHELELIETELAKLQSETSQLQEKLADAKSRQKTIIMRQNTVSSRLQVKKRLDSSTVDNAMGRFEQFERKIDDLESQVESYDVGKRSLKDEFAELETDGKIDDELAALKQKMAGNKSAPSVTAVGTKKTKKA
ncbi:phage shock protein PspA [Glaciecola sp. XM2]|jgi:phage shock protein A|uniref:phage shock protein PspA n=1 Tax=Glaciecola sp. XM2 TaxID=1914931 RepID=UPI001BDDFE3A|nr:phage shock protein PspA [Glaciecola sp. XM2]MBT1450872.1 phage shock protein PspA [Glaciecola sp. XM2]